MKKYSSILLLLLLTTGFSHAQKSCCSMSSSTTMAFADLGNEKAFVASHLAPLPLDFQAEIGKMLSLKTTDGKETKIFEVKSGPSQGKVILMFHEWWGLNDYIKREAERLHKETGFTVIAMDLYDGKVATNPDDAGKMMQSMKDDRARAIITAALDYVGKFGKVQTIGWCMGGGWSLQAAIMAGQQGYGAVMYYGMPEKDQAKLAQIQGPVLGIFAKKDQWITPEVVTQFEADMKTAGKTLTVVNYDADHAFANPSNPKYMKAFSEEAHAKVLAFVKKNFEGPLRPAVVPAEK